MFNGGGMDAGFGQAGVASLSQLPRFSTMVTTVQSDDKTVLVGTVTPTGSSNHLLEVSRLNSDGSLDKTFGTNGVFATNYKLDTNYRAAAVTVQPNGKVVIVASEDVGTIVTQHILGPATYTSDQQWRVIRLNSNGSLDQTFGVKGVSTVGTFEDGPSIGGVAVQPDGKIVFASSVFNSDNTQSVFETVRLLPNGALDSTFGDPVGNGHEGYVKTALGSFVDNVDGLVLEPSGRIVVGGTISDNGYGSLGLIRYNVDGTLDTRYFNSTGKTVAHFNGDVQLKGLSEDNQGDLYAVGGDRISLSVGLDAASTAQVVRFTGDGKLDAGFGGSNGVLLKLSSGSNADYATLVTFPQPGKVLIAGSSAGNTAFEAQYLSNGTFDLSFGTRGYEKFANVAGAGAAAATSDGKVVLVGASEALRTVDAEPIVWIKGVQDGMPGGMDGEFTFNRDSVYNFPTRVYFQTSGTATPIADFTGPLAPSLNLKGHTILNPAREYVDIPAGKSSVTVFAHVARNLPQPTESLTVTPLNNAAYLVARGASATITLRNPTIVPIG